MTSLFRLSLFVLLTIYLASCTAKLSSIKTDQTRELEENTGYLFITIDTNTRFSRFAIEGPTNILLKNPDYYEGKNYYLVPVQAGEYQIKQFGSTYGARYTFNDEGDENLWGFSVRPGVISYVGELRVRQLRYLSSTFELINNSSLALEYLEKKYPKILANRKLEYHGPGQDIFYNYVFEKNNNKTQGEE